MLSVAPSAVVGSLTPCIRPQTAESLHQGGPAEIQIAGLVVDPHLPARAAVVHNEAMEVARTARPRTSRMKLHVDRLPHEASAALVPGGSGIDGLLAALQLDEPAPGPIRMLRCWHRPVEVVRIGQLRRLRTLGFQADG